ncbi:hypothetical protein XavaCFBP5823_10135 [Xanthomonas axonopodis pv. vasculorum]|nr:hypothetical protein XavaCFBP5823_10135 [Xanthomonas axonopodis pv. vasculorum]
MTRCAGTSAELEAPGVRVRPLRDLLDLPAVVVGTLGVIDAGACSGEAAGAPISCLSCTANWHRSTIAWR